jgi:hypothetical protein
VVNFSGDYLGSYTIDSKKISLASDVVVGDKFIDLVTYAPYRPGDRVVITQPTTTAWLSSVEYGGGVEQLWSTASFRTMTFYRIVKAVYGKRIELDAPITTHINLEKASSFVNKVVPPSDANFVQEVGIEGLTIDIETLGDNDEDHFW